MEYIPDAYIDRGDLLARGTGRNPSSVLGEKIELLNPKEPRVTEQTKQQTKVVNHSHFRKAWETILGHEEFITKGSRAFARLSERLPNMDTLNMNMLALTEIIRMFLNLSISQIDSRTQHLDQDSDLTEHIVEFKTRFRELFEKAKSLFKNGSADKLILDAFRYAFMINAFDRLWIRSQIENS